jgi:curved DNA-binding protein CbpA
MADFDTIFAIEAEALAQIVDELDYFQILKIEQSATTDSIKAGYFRESRIYHPDQFFRSPEGIAKQAVSKIYKRINEAWVCLRDDRKRTKYIQDVNGPNRARKLRYTDESEEELKRARDLEQGATPQGRKTFQQGLVDLEAGRLAQAVLNLKMAIQFEPQNPLFKQKLDEAVRLSAETK